MTAIKFHITSDAYLDDFDKIFDPKFNTMLTWPHDSYANQKKFIKHLWDLNGNLFLDEISKTSDAVKKFVNKFRTTIPREDWWFFSFINQFDVHGNTIEFFHGDNHTSMSNPAVFDAGFLTFWSKVKKSERKLNSFGNIFGIYGSLISFWKGGVNAYAGKRTVRISDLQNTTYTLSVEYHTNDKSQLLLDKIKVNMMLSYESRSTLYKHFEYSTKIFDVVGNRDDWHEKGEGNTPLYGVELEVSTDYKDQAIIDAFPEIFAFIKKDSTITGSKSYPGEIVTIPASLRKHKRMWSSFFKNLTEDMFDCLDKHNNGMHVHIDRKAFDVDTLHLKKFCAFFTNPVNHKFLVEISERTSDSLAAHAKLVTAPKSTSGKGYTFSHSDRHLRSAGRKTCVNLENAATVEVRLFKGIVSFASIIKNLEFVEAMVDFSREKSFIDMNIGTFLKWLKYTPASLYRTLKMCLEDIDFGTMMIEAELENAIKYRGLTAAQVVLALNKINPDKKFIAYTIKVFNEHFAGNKLTNDDGTFKLFKQHTKFSKFNERVLGMYVR